MTSTDLEISTFQKRPTYRYLRAADRLPSIAEATAQDEPVALVKLFNPTGSFTWYVAGYDPETRIAWGLVDGLEKEIGDFYMGEIVEYRGRFGLPIERDLHWHPKPLAAL